MRESAASIDRSPGRPNLTQIGDISQPGRERAGAAIASTESTANTQNAVRASGKRWRDIQVHRVTARETVHDRLLIGRSGPGQARRSVSKSDLDSQ